MQLSGPPSVSGNWQPLRSNYQLTICKSHPTKENNVVGKNGCGQVTMEPCAYVLLPRKVQLQAMMRQNKGKMHSEMLLKQIYQQKTTRYRNL